MLYDSLSHPHLLFSPSLSPLSLLPRQLGIVHTSISNKSTQPARLFRQETWKLDLEVTFSRSINFTVHSQTWSIELAR